jgi:hypothetical protein
LDRATASGSSIMALLLNFTANLRAIISIESRLI